MNSSDKVLKEMHKLCNTENIVAQALGRYGQLIEAITLKRDREKENRNFLQALANLTAYITYIKQHTGATEQGYRAEINRQLNAEKDGSGKVISFTAHKIKNGYI